MGRVPPKICNFLNLNSGENIGIGDGDVPDAFCWEALAQNHILVIDPLPKRLRWLVNSTTRIVISESMCGRILIWPIRRIPWNMCFGPQELGMDIHLHQIRSKNFEYGLVIKHGNGQLEIRHLVQLFSHSNFHLQRISHDFPLPRLTKKPPKPTQHHRRLGSNPPATLPRCCEMAPRRTGRRGWIGMSLIKINKVDYSKVDDRFW